MFTIDAFCICLYVLIKEVSKLEKFFKLKENGTNVKREILAGITTFVAMAYIIAVNPGILSASGMDQSAVFTGTIIASIIGTLLMGLWAKLPFALAPGMGLNAFFAYTIVLGMGKSWQFALTAVLIEGIIFLIMSFFNVRETIVNMMPKALRDAIAVGIGVFIALIGFINGKLLFLNEATSAFGLTTFNAADPNTIPALVCIFGLILMSVLLVLKVPGALLIGIAGSTVLALILGVAAMPTAFVSLPPSVAPVFFKFEWSQILSIEMLVAVFTFLFTDIFDTVGTLLGVATKAKMFDKNGNLPRVKQALTSDAIATVAGAALGTSTVTTYVESAAGVAEGGRTGLTAVTTAACFVVALFFSPLVLIVPGFATAPALILVGVFMMQPIMEIDFTKYTVAIPAFFAVVIMAFSYYISTGIGYAMISYTLLNLLGKKEDRKNVNAMLIVVSILFILKFIVKSFTG